MLGGHGHLLASVLSSVLYRLGSISGLPHLHHWFLRRVCFANFHDVAASMGD
jgi:hypothetical protein